MKEILKLKSDHFLAPTVQKYLECIDMDYAYHITENLAYNKKFLTNKMGFRNAGSDAEHAAADYILSEMDKIGLVELEKVPVKVDKWQFNSASFTIEKTDIDIMPASYPTSGTDEAGITAELADVGFGTAKDYADKDVKGKIVIAGVDQRDIAWIDRYMNEAANHGAAALISYAADGYAMESDDLINVQDTCGKDVIPCVSISRNQYKKIKQAISEGHTKATLKIDSELDIGNGITYNVVGRIKGESSKYQIVISGHYDAYWNGFQDDCSAIGLFMEMARAMKESGYIPKNDLVFTAHGAEEWGAVGSQFDWTVGAWRMINEAKPDWAGKTLAMFNFEMTALYDDMEYSYINCEPEFASMVKSFVEESGLAAPPVEEIYPKGISGTTVDTHCKEDGVSYRMAGIPHFVNLPGFNFDKDYSWNHRRYHTAGDNKDTYNEAVMHTNLNTFGALIMYVDQMPALKLDFTATCSDLEEALNEEIAAMGGCDIKAYRQSLRKFETACQKWNEGIDAVNQAYCRLIQTGGNAEKIQVCRREGERRNQVSLEVFKRIQDDLIGIIYSDSIVIKHLGYQNNIELLLQIIALLNEGKLTGDQETIGALDLAKQLNGGMEYGYYIFSPETNNCVLETFSEKKNEGNVFFGTGKGFKLVNTHNATISLLSMKDSVKKSDFEKEREIYQEELTEQLLELKHVFELEINAMERLADILTANVE